MRILILAALFIFALQVNAQTIKTVEKISWYGQAAVRIDNDGQKIFIDPYHLPGKDEADVILITHSHGDHLSIEDIRKIYNKNTTFYCPADCEAILRENDLGPVTIVQPGDILLINGTKVLTVPMYNVEKTNYHPKENNWCGYIVDVGGVKVYHAGDTERIPEMKEIDCDIAMLPLGQTYTMNSVEEAEHAALDTGAEIAIPIHYGMYEGTKDDAQKFKELLEGKIQVILLEQIK